MRRHTESSVHQLRPFLGATTSPAHMRLIEDDTRGFPRERHDLLERRRAREWVRDGRGVPRCDNIRNADPVPIFDHIEFNRRFRVEEVVSEVALLAMDLDAHGRPDLTSALVTAYSAAFPDPELFRLLPFHACYRVVVLGKVASPRLGQPGLSAARRCSLARQARRYFDLADGHANPRSTSLVVAGLSGVGRSTLAAKLGEVLDWPVVSSDSVRKALARLEPEARPAVCERTTRALGTGRSVVLDATFLPRERRAIARRIGRGHGARLERRRRWQPITVDDARACVIDTARPRWRARRPALARLNQPTIFPA